MIKFTELFKDETKYGTKIKAGEYNTVGKYPIVDQGKNLIAGYTNREDGIYKNVPVIIFGDHTRIIKYIDKPFFLGADGVKILKSKKENANYRYLYYALRNVHIPNTGYNRHFKWLKEIYIRYPSDKEQESMVKTLDSISSIMNKKRKEVEYLDCLVKARFSELFGDLHVNPKRWPIKSFNDIAKIDTRMIHDFKGYESLPHIGIDSIEKDTGRLCGYRTIEEDGVISGKYLFSPKHIIYSKIRPNLNKVAMPNFKGVCSADAYPILVNEKECTREFLAYVMRSSIFLDYILAFSNRTNLPKVNKKQVEGFSCPVPPLNCQMEFTDFFYQVAKSKFTISKYL